MSENTTNSRNVRDDEIDLLDLFNRIGRSLRRGFNALWKAFLITVVFLVRRWIPLTISIVLGLAVSVFMMKTTPSLYSSDMVLRNNVAPNDQLISYINRLQTLDKETLAKTLGVSNVTSQNIASVGAYWIIDKNKDRIPDNVDYTNTHDVYDTTNIRMLDRIDISVRVKSPQDLDAVRDGIIKYIEANPVFRKMNDLRLSHNEELFNRTSIDIQQLDSLQKVKFFEESRDKMASREGQIVFVQEQATQMFYHDIYALYNRKAGLEDNLNLYSGIVTLLNDFSIPTMRVNGLDYYAKKNVPAFFVAMLLILTIIANTKGLKEVYKKY